MASVLRPNICVRRVSDLDFDKLYKEGFRFALLDFDNTLAPDHFTEPVDYSYEMVKRMQQSGLSLCLVSNAKSERSSKIAKMLDIPCISYAHKPSPRGVLKAMGMLSAQKENTLMIGDQIFTDIIAGNRAGVHTVLVERYAKKEVFYVLVKRIPEWFVRKILRF